MHLSRTMISLACLCLASSARALTPTQIFSRASPAVVVLETFDENENKQRLGSHSATVIKPERLVAMCDVLETAATLSVATKSGGVVARVTARDRERNLCLISAPGLAAAPISRRTQMLPVGSRVFAVSNALGLGIGISEGVISGIRNFSIGAYVQFSAPISPGSEGSALVDDGGRLVGIIDYRRRDGQNVNFASMAQWISEIESRAVASEARLKRFDRAMALSKQQQWSDLQTMATIWSSEEPVAKDAWRFVVAASRGRGDSEAELQGWKALYQIDSSSIEAGAGLGRAFMASGKTREALDLARQLQTAHQEDAACWLFLAQAQQASGQMQAAEQSCRRAVELDPWLMDAYRGTAVLAQMRGDSKTAISIWKRMSGLFSNQLWPRIGLVDAYLAAGKSALAWSTLGQVADSDTDNALVWYLRGITLARIGCPGTGDPGLSEKP